MSPLKESLSRMQDDEKYSLSRSMRDRESKTNFDENDKRSVPSLRLIRLIYVNKLDEVTNDKENIVARIITGLSLSFMRKFL